MSEGEYFEETSGDPAVRGFVHRPAEPVRATLVLTHGAGSNCDAPLLVALSEAFAEKGMATLRCDLPYRQRQPQGPPRGTASTDQAGLRRAVEVMRKEVAGPIFMGGISHGGRQATLLAAAEPNLVDGLVILSYPLHPPGKPNQLRISHLSKIKNPALLVSGAKDPFGAPEELKSAIDGISAETRFISLEGVGHDLGYGRRVSAAQRDLPQRIVRVFEQFFFKSELA